MNKKTLSQALMVLRILLGIAMIYFGATKFGADANKMAFIGWAAYGLGLTFLSTTTWFWVATIGEILAWILLIMGKCYTKYGAGLTLIIMIFVGNAIGWNFADPMFSSVFFLSIVVLWLDWYLCESCDDKTCCGGSCSTKKEIIEA